MDILKIENLIGLDNAYDLGKREIIIKNETIYFYTNNFLINSTSVTLIVSSLLEINENNGNLMDTIYSKLSGIGVSKIFNIEKICDEIYKGLLVICSLNADYAVVVDIRSYPTRGVSDADTEKVVRGSKESFTENVATNVGLLRRRIKSGNLKVIKYTIGNISKTDIALVYLENYVNKKALKVVEQKLNSINVDELTMSDKALEELLTNKPLNPFPIVKYTERPDTLAIHLYQGQFGLIVDTSPSVMLAPISLFDHLQAPEEFRQSPISGTFLRLIRLIGIIISFLIVPTWISLVNRYDFHNTLIESIMHIDASNKVLLIQIIVCEISVELVRMASIHTPNSLSQSMGLIVGIILGGVLVDLKIIDQSVLLLVAISQVGSFITPSYELSLTNKIVQLILLLISYFLGIIGLIISLVFLIIYLAFLKSFGVPFLKPLIPFSFKELLRHFIRTPYKNKDK